MRSYPTDSPEAVARIVALALLADGNLHAREWAALDRMDAPGRLGLQPAALRGVMNTFCEDLLATADTPWSQSCKLDDATLAALMAEVQDEALRIRVLQLCVAVIEADSHLAPGEYQVLEAAARHWRVSVDQLDLCRTLEAAHG